MGGVVKEVTSLLTFSKGLGTINETARWQPQSASSLLGPLLSFLKTCLLLKILGKHKGTDWAKFVALHPFPDCMDPFSMQCTMEVELTVGKQKDPFLVFL